MSKELLNCFFNECESRFRFLEQEYGYQYFSGLATLEGGRQVIRPYKGQEVKAPFFATNRYEKNRRAIEISYGDEDYSLGAHIHIDFIHRLHVNDLLKAAQKDDTLVLPPLSARQPMPLKGGLGYISDLFKDNIKTLIDPPQRLTDKALNMRGKMMEEKIRQHYRTMMEAACNQAAKAYTQKDYARVIELYSPYEPDLSPADRKKLDKAREAMKKL